MDPTTGRLIRVACGRPRCSLYCRDKYAADVADNVNWSVRETPPRFGIRISAPAGMTEPQFRKCVERFLRRLRKLLGRDMEYMLVHEFEDRRHVHVLVSTARDLTTTLVGETLAKIDPRYTPRDHACTTIGNAEALVNYVLKALRDDTKKRLPPEDFRGRFVIFSRKFLVAPLDVLRALRRHLRPPGRRRRRWVPDVSAAEAVAMLLDGRLDGMRQSERVSQSVRQLLAATLARAEPSEVGGQRGGTE